MKHKNTQVQSKSHEDGYSNLGNAIILQAVKDYRDALKALRFNPHSTERQKMKSDVERFFVSSWFSALTEIDGRMLMKKLQMEVE